MRRSLHRLIAAGVASAAVAVLPAPALADGAPAVQSESAVHVTATDATLLATIDPGESHYGVYYQFQVVKDPGEYPPAIVCPGITLPPGYESCGPLPLQHTGMPIGFIAAGSSAQSVSQDLAAAGVALQAGTTYHYRVVVVRRVLTEDTLDWEGPPIEGPDRTFTTPPAAAPVIDSVSISPSTTSGGSQSLESHPSGSLPPSSSSPQATPGAPLRTVAGPAAKRHGAHRAKTKHRRHHRPAKHAKHPAHTRN